MTRKGWKSYDVQVTVPYNKIMLDGEVTFYLKLNSYLRATETAPAEGGDWEIVHKTGQIIDDDIPDVEELAFCLADEKFNEMHSI